MVMKVFFVLLGTRATWWVKRQCSRSNSGLVRKAARLLWYSLQFCSGSSISHEAHFASPPLLVHDHGIFVGGGAVIGRDCVIFPNVVIGSDLLADSSGFGVPRIGDNCYLGAGACIVGSVRIGDRCRVGANSTVWKDVPDDSVCVGNNRVIRKTHLDNRFYRRRRGWWEYYRGGRWIRTERSPMKPEKDHVL